MFHSGKSVIPDKERRGADGEMQNSCKIETPNTPIRERAVAMLRLVCWAGCLGVAACGSLVPSEPAIGDKTWVWEDPPNDSGKLSFVRSRISSDYRPPDCPQTKLAATNFKDQDRISLCVHEMLDLIDVQYDRFETQLFSAVSDTNFFIDTIVSGVGIAGGFLTGGASQATSAIAGGLTGFNKNIDSDLLYSKTIQILIQQMRKDRATQKTVILERLKVTKSQRTPITAADVGQAKADAANAAATAAVTMMSAALTAKTGATAPAAANANVSASVQQQVASAAAAAASTNPAALPYNDIYDAADDLLEYAKAGSWSHALISLQSDTSTGASGAKADLNATKTGTTPAPSAPKK